MLHFKIKEILLASGHRYPAVWLTKHCEFTEARAYKLLHGKQKTINLKDFSKLCENLNCTPNDLMYWEVTPQVRLQPTHPCISQLTPPIKNSDWDSIFKQLTPDKILKLHQQALDAIEKK